MRNKLLHKPFTKNNKFAFSIIEIIIAIFIFSMWIVSIYAVITSTLKLNDYNKNYIIASSLASEQIEFVRNIRDSNYKQIKKYNLINPLSTDYNNKFDIDKKYKIENNYSTLANFPIKVENITSWFEEGKEKINWTSMQSYRLCLDSKNRYTYDCSSWNKKTNFYKYISIEKFTNSNWNIQNAFIVRSKVIWTIWGYKEFEVKTIIADFKRL